jgi:DNA-binding NarL/FixJ family response regulator
MLDETAYAAAKNYPQNGAAAMSNETTPPRRPRILVADDHLLIRERVTDLLEGLFEVVGTVTNGKDLLTEAESFVPDIIVLDITMPGLSGIGAAHRLRLNSSPAKLVFLTIHDQPQFVRRCMAEGAMGYVIKSRLESDLVHAIEEALLNRRFVSPPLTLPG